MLMPIARFPDCRERRTLTRRTTPVRSQPCGAALSGNQEPVRRSIPTAAPSLNLAVDASPNYAALPMAFT